MVTLDYRPSEYFNRDEHYVFLDVALDRLLVSTVEHVNGNWFATHGLRFKCTSAPCCRFAEIGRGKVKYKNITGHISKPLESHNCVGVQWHDGLNYYWNNVNLLLKTKEDNIFYVDL